MTFDTMNSDERREKLRLIESALDESEQGLWDQSVGTNQAILEMDAEDVSALNRLGRSLTKLGRLREALNSYERSLTVDPANAIALRNAARLRDVLDRLDTEEVPAADALEVRAEHFIMDTGRSAVLSLEDLSPAQQIATLLPGDSLELRAEGPYLGAYSSSGDQVGLIPADRAHRLIELIQAGNRYSAVVVHASVDGVDVLVRETYRSPETHGKLPFPALVRVPSESRTAARAARTPVADEEFLSEPDVDDEAEETDDAQTEPLAETDDADEVEE